MATACRGVNQINVIEVRGRTWDKREDIEREGVHFLQHLYIGNGRSGPRMELH